MRMVRWVLAVLSLFVCLGAASAAAANGPAWPIHVRTTPAKAAPVPVVVMTLAKLPQYPWVHPVWVRIGGLTVPRLSL